LLTISTPSRPKHTQELDREFLQINQEIIMASSNQGGNNKGNNQSDSGSGNSGSKQSDSSNRGFASMDPQQQREIAAEGGRAAHASGNGHEFTSEEARKAGAMSHKNDGNQQSDSNAGGARGSSGGQGGNKQSDSESGSGGRGGSGSGGRSK
jgi:hypothetical protein